MRGGREEGNSKAQEFTGDYIPVCAGLTARELRVWRLCLDQHARASRSFLQPVPATASNCQCYCDFRLNFHAGSLSSIVNAQRVDKAHPIPPLCHAGEHNTEQRSPTTHTSYLSYRARQYSTRFGMTLINDILKCGSVRVVGR